MGTGAGTGYFTGGYYTTDHSFQGSLVIQENTWLFIHIDYNPDTNYHPITSIGNFDTLGGTLLHSTSFTVTDVNYWDTNVKHGCITAGLIDNSYSLSPWVIVGEARYELEDGGNAPLPEPATMLLFGTGIAGLAAARRRKKAC